MILRRISTAFALLVLLLVAFAGSASAHASANSADGKVRVTWGLLEEPGFTHEKNRLDLIIRDAATSAGIAGVDTSGVKIELVYGEEKYDLGNVTVNRAVKGGSFAGPGNYTSAKFVYLTSPGIYTLHISGTINGSAVDLTIPATHEYEPMGEIMFPEEIEIGGAGDTSDLEARIAALEAKTSTMSQTPAPVITQPTSPPSKDAPAAGILLATVALVAAALVLRRK